MRGTGSRVSMRVGLAVLAVGAGTGALAGSASGAVGDLIFQGCVADTNAAGCSAPAQAALASVDAVAVSPDGRSVYVGSAVDGSVSTFNRAANGALTYQSCVADTAIAGCTVPAKPALAGVQRLAVSPDGGSVYVTAAGDSAISHFTRAANGALTFQDCFSDAGIATCNVPGGTPSLNFASGVAVSPDNGSVYVASLNDGAITAFTRLPNGTLNYQACITDVAVAGCTALPALGGAVGVTVSPDNSSVYAVSQFDSSVSAFTRVPSGVLTYQGCFADTAIPGCTVPALQALGGPRDVAVSPDNGSVYVGARGDNSVSTFNRAPGGNLTFQTCVADTGIAGCTVPAQAALDDIEALAVSPDNGSLFVASGADDAISHFGRAPGGALSFNGCFADTAAAGCKVPPQAALDGTIGVATSPDSASVYGASVLDGAVSHFTREAPPAAADTTPPETSKGKGPKKKVKTKKPKAKLKFEFSSPEPGVVFECGLDKQPFTSCTSPAKVKVKAKRKAKKHTFSVRAVDAAGNADQTPVVFKFKLTRKR